ncbi:MAG TPA: lysophospholipid acyltransferase family protein [Thermoanaerobaculia bacterium]
MLRTLLLLVVAIPASAVTATLVALIGLLKSSARPIDWLIRHWARLCLAAAGIELVVEGAEKLDPARRYVLVANHASYLDIPVLFVAIPQPLRFFAKRSLFQIPIFGWGLKASGFIPIDRKKRSRNVASFDLATSRIEKGNSIVIFPEEGRSRAPQMRPFKRGAFLLALKSELPLVPAAIAGTWDVLPATRSSVRPGKVLVRIADPIETADLSIRQKDELMRGARARIAEMLVGTSQEQRPEAEEA